MAPILLRRRIANFNIPRGDGHGAAAGQTARDLARAPERRGRRGGGRDPGVRDTG